MWDNNAGGGHDGGYGGQSDGGFMVGSSQFDSPSTKDQSKARKTQNLVPMTLKSLLRSGDDGMQLGGLEVHMAVVVGLIRAVDISSTKVTYTLDDCTAEMEMIQWIESDTGIDDDGRTNLMEMTYCRAVGSLRNHQGNRHLLAIQITPITDLNLLTTHLLSVMHAALKINHIQSLQASDGGAAGGASSSMSNSLVGAGGLGVGVGFGGGDGVGGYAGGMQGLSGQQNLVYQVIHQCSSTSGVPRSTIYTALNGKVQNREIDQVLDFLSGEGHIYTTLDDDHFKATDA